MDPTIVKNAQSPEQNFLESIRVLIVFILGKIVQFVR
jgi:hypothetical protein